MNSNFVFIKKYNILWKVHFGDGDHILDFQRLLTISIKRQKLNSLECKVILLILKGIPSPLLVRLVQQG